MTPLVLRKARLGDIPDLIRLIQIFVDKGVMLPRNALELAEHIRDFMVVTTAEGQLLGAGALHLYTPEVAEIRTLAVRPNTQGLGIGRKIVDSLAAEAVDLGLQSIFAFTYVTGFFEKLGFSEVPRHELPQKVWKDCLRCPKFQACDEIAVRRHLQPASAPLSSLPFVVLSEEDSPPLPRLADPLNAELRK